MENKKHTTDRTDELLHMALEDYVRQTPPELKTKKQMQEEGELHQFSPEFEKRFGNLLRESQTEKRRHTRNRVMARIAACLLLIIGVGAVTISSVDALRVQFMSFILNIGQESAEIIESTDNNTPVSDKYKSAYPSYIPDGFVMISFGEYDNGYSVAYQDSQAKFFQLDCFESSNRFSLDAEGSDVQKIDINGSKATLSVRDGKVVVSYPTEKYNYLLSGDIASDEAVNILESIQ